MEEWQMGSQVVERGEGGRNKEKRERGG